MMLALFKGEKESEGPVKFIVQSAPSGANDFVEGSLITARLISKRMLSLLKHYRLTGWSTYPVELFSGGKRLRRSYYGLSVTGRCGPIDWSRRERIRINSLVHKGERMQIWQGLPFDENSWDGSDFFVTRGEDAFLFVTRHAKLVLQSERITNIVFFNPDTFETADD